MNIIDSAIISQVNSLSRQSMFLDHFMSFLAHNPLLKGGVLATIIWWLWFSGRGQRPFVREHIIATVLLCFPAIALARGLAAFLPFRLRPMHETGMDFVIPYGVNLEILDGWSSFPSDHAVLFFALATGLFFISRGIGVFAFLYCSFVIGFPRIYLGLHYPTDIIAGALLGVAMGWLGNVYIVRDRGFQSGLDWLWSRPGLFYPSFFLVTYQIADLFSSSRGLLRSGVKVIKILLD